MAEDVQYKNACIDNSERTIDINTVYEEFDKDKAYRDLHVFNCPCCGLEMEAVLVGKRKKHFRHKGNPCGYNNFMHSTAEQVFFEEYKKCLDQGTPFIVSVFPEIQCDSSCTITNRASCYKSHKDRADIDLTSIYKKISPEERIMIDGRYRRPDLLLESDSGEKLMVEIWVSHETGDEKRKQGKVLEIKISSEDDIDKIRTHKLTQSKPSDKSLRYFVWKEICPDPELPRNFAEENSDRLLVREEGFPGRLRPQEREWLVSQAHYRIIRPPVNLTHPLDPETLKEVSVGDIPFWKREKGLEWVNLGLPSGTLWSKEYMGSMTFEEVMREFPHLIPNLEQYQELASLCKTTIPNPAGFIGPNGVLLEMYEGDFWVDFSIDESHAMAFHKYDVVNRAQHNKLPLLQVLGFVKADKRKRLCVRLVKNER